MNCLSDAYGQILPTPINLQVPLIVQNTPAWDWVAVAQQLIATKFAPNPPPSQCELVEFATNATKGTCCHIYSSGCEVSGSMNQVAWLIAQSGANVLPFPLPTTPLDIHKSLMAGRPLIVLLKDIPSQGSVHFVIVRGMSNSNQNGNAVAILHINDPWSVYVRQIPFQNIAENFVQAITVGQ